MSFNKPRAVVNHAEIKRRRDELKLTLDEASQRCGFHGRQRWHDIERGRRPSLTAETLFLISKALECEAMDELMTVKNYEGRRGRKIAPKTHDSETYATAPTDEKFAQAQEDPGPER